LSSTTCDTFLKSCNNSAAVHLISPAICFFGTCSVLLHYDSSKRCVYPLYKFVYSFKVVELFLKHLYICINMQLEFTAFPRRWYVIIYFNNRNPCPSFISSIFGNEITQSLCTCSASFQIFTSTYHSWSLSICIYRHIAICCEYFFLLFQTQVNVA
jgi:hypothetical protein